MALDSDIIVETATSKVIFIDHVAGEIIRLIASVSVHVSIHLSVGALLFEPFDL